MVQIINRATGALETEQVYGESALNFIYGDDLFSKVLGVPLLHLLVKNPIFSALYGWWQKQPITKRKIAPFIKNFRIDASEFLDDPTTFRSFNDFFIRKLRPSTRPFSLDPNVAIIPADARYYFYQNIEEADGFLVKGEKFDLHSLLQDDTLAHRYNRGAMVLARLCPTDYHRFHFPCDCIPGPTHFINGWLYSVNPIALKKDIHIFTENKRAICELETTHFGKVLYIEIGATNVGSINETYEPGKPYLKSAEKGFFSFGASSLILLFEPNRIRFDQDLLNTSAKKIEVRCLLGQTMGLSLTQL